MSSAGRVTAGVEVEIMDDDGEPVKRGEIGEFWLRSRGVCLGYLDNPEKQQKSFMTAIGNQVIWAIKMKMAIFT